MSNRCDICPGEFAPIPGVGPKPCRTVFIGERPGATENLKGRVFCGKTGDELDRTYLPLAGLRREDVYTTNATKCWALGNRTPSEKEVLGCGRCFLPRELEACRPEVVVLLGGSACRLIDRTEAQGRVRIDYAHGRPMWASLLGGAWEGWVWPSYHPALGMHDTTKMTPLLEDFRRLGEWMAGEWEPPAPVEVEKDYRLVRGASDLGFYFNKRRIDELAIDTESHGPAPFSIQVSHTPHTGCMILATDKSAINELACRLIDFDPTVIFHHAIHDLDDMARMDVQVTRFRDTMQEAFQHGGIPQGLKPLAYRLLGVEMTSWQEVVWPASVDAIVTWLMNAADLAQQLAEVKTTELATYRCLECGHKAHAFLPGVKGSEKCGSKAGEWKGIKGGCTCDFSSSGSNLKHEQRPSATETVLRHVLNHTIAVQTGEEPYDPWKKLKEMRTDGLRGRVPEEWEWDWLEQELGPVPILGIGNAAIEDAVAYGCSDADHTLQVARVLRERRGDKRYVIDPSDRDI